MGIINQTAELEWKDARAAKKRACPKCGSIAPAASETHPTGEGIFECDWATALVKFATGLVGKQEFKEIANAQLAKGKPNLWPK